MPQLTSDQAKQLVSRFIEEAFNQHEIEKAAEHLSDEYIQHSPLAVPGRQGFVETIGRLAEEHPEMSMDVHRMIAEEDLVAAHCHLKLGHGRGYAIVEFFRIEDGLIKEHWDALQEISDDDGTSESIF
jgi:predicted SnoaL-like aldol condensation-catalyzing enzyme